MTRASWTPGAVIRRSLGDGSTYYGRLLEFPYATFYDLRTPEPSDDLPRIVASEKLFTVAAHKDLVGEWDVVGQQPLDDAMRPPPQFRQNLFDPSDCAIVEADGSERPATVDECEGLERAAVWEPEHIADRLIDHYAGRPNMWLRSLELKRP